MVLGLRSDLLQVALHLLVQLFDGLAVIQELFLVLVEFIINFCGKESEVKAERKLAKSECFVL